MSRPMSERPDDEIREALKRDEALVPDLSAVRREVGRARIARRNRNGWWAGGLVAACVLVVSTAVAMSAFRVDGGSAAPGIDTAQSRSVETGPADSGSTDRRHGTDGRPDTGSAPVDGGAVTGPGGDRTATGSTSSGQVSRTTPVASPPRTPTPAGTPRLIAIPRLVSGSTGEGAMRHCQSQSIAWPLTADGRIDVVALRQAVNECSVGFGNGPQATALYSLPTLAAVLDSSPLFHDATVPADVDLEQRVLVIRLEGQFPEIASAGQQPTAVQVYLTATDAQWIGAEDTAPVDPSVFGAPVLPVT